MKKIFTLLLLAGQTIYGLAQNCNPLDVSFGTSGKAIGISSHDYAFSRNIIVQPDGKIIQVGGTYGSNRYHFTIARYNDNGSIDNGFGQNGNATAITGGEDYPYYGALQGDGKIVVVGHTYNNGTADIAVVRFNSNGSLDNGFGTGGKVVTSIGPQYDYARGLAIQPDGKIIVVGSTQGNCFSDINCYNYYFCQPLFAVIRYNSNGSLDNTFGQNGKVTANVGPTNAGEAVSVALQPDGKIIVAGQSLYNYACDDYYGMTYYTSSFFSMVRYNSNGELDLSFGKNGKVEDSLDMVATTAIALQADGKIVVTGSHRNGGSIVERYNDNGSLDSSFSQGGKVVIGPGWLNSAAVLPDGKIVLAGGAYINASNFFVCRLQSNGRSDTSFNGTGRVNFHLGPTNSYDYAAGIALQNGHLIVGGASQYSQNNSSSYDLLLVRLRDSISGLAVVITPGGTLTPCQGESVRLVCNETGTIQWFRDGNLLTGFTDTVLTAISSGFYTVSVSNSKGCGQSEVVNVRINGLPVVITANSSLNICEGDSVKLTSSEAGSLRWFKNGILINGAEDTSYKATSAGSYTVSVRNAKGCGTSAPANVAVISNKPFITWDGVKLNTVSGYYSYQWYLNGSTLAGANANFIQPLQIGSYKVVISDYKCSPSSDEFKVDCNLIAVPKPSISWNGAQLATTSGYSDYQWSVNGNVIAGVHVNLLRPTQAGIYKVTVTGNLNCTNTSDEFNFNCASYGPSKPPITWTNSYFFTTIQGYSHYQWSLNGTPIPGNDSVSYKPSQTGVYKVTVTDNFGCANTSDSFNLVILGVADIVLGDAKLRCYPNPVRTMLNVDVSNGRSNKLTAEFYDVTGRLVQKRLLNQNKNQLPVQTLPPGLYQLVIHNKNEKTVVKIMVIK